MNFRELVTSGSILGIVILAFFFALLGFVFASVWPKTYEAKAVLVFPVPGQRSPESGRAVLPDFSPQLGAQLLGGLFYLPTMGATSNSVIDIINSRAALEAVMQKHGNALFGSSPDDYDFQTLSDQLSHEATENGNLVVSFRWQNREEASDVLKSILEFTENRVDAMNAEFASDALKFFEEEVESRRKIVSEKAEKLRIALQSSPLALGASNRLDYVSQLIKATSVMRDLESHLNAQTASLNTRLAAFRKAVEEGAEGDAFTSVSSKMQEELALLKRKLQEAEKTLASNAPEMQRLHASFQAASEAYVQELERVLNAAKHRSSPLTLEDEAKKSALMAQIQSTSKTIRELREENLLLVNMELEQRQLANDLALAEDQLKIAETQYSTVKLAEQRKYKPFVILDEPYASAYHVFPRRGIFTLGGMAFGLFLGMFFYVRRMSMDLSDSSGENT